MKNLVFMLAFVLLSIAALEANEGYKMLLDYSESGRGELRNIARNQQGTIVCTGYKGTMIRSEDDGETWASIEHKKLYEFSDVEHHNGTWYAAGYEWINDETMKGKFLRIFVLLYSTDDGKTWARSGEIEGIEKLTLFNYYGQSIVKGAENEVYIATRAGALLRSTNNGESWKVCSIIANDTTDRAFQVTCLKDGSIYAFLKDTQYVSVDQGQTWAAKNNDIIGTPMCANVFNDTIVVVTKTLIKETSTFQIRVCYSADRGISWVQNLANNPAGIVRFFSFSTKQSLGMGENEFVGIGITNDGGITWDSVGNQIQAVDPSDAVRINDSTAIFCGRGKGIFRLNLNAKSIQMFSFARRNVNFPGRVGFLRVQEGGDITFSTSKICQVTRSINNGATWKLDSLLDTSSTSILDAIEFNNGTQIILKENSPYVLRRTSPESAFTEVKNVLIGSPARLISNSHLTFIDDDTGVFTASLETNGRHGLCYTVDGGATWTRRFADSIDLATTRMVKDSNGTLIVAANYVRNAENIRARTNILISSDLGQTWEQRPFVDGMSIDDIAVINRSTIVAVSRTVNTVNDGIGFLHCSTDGGYTWKSMFEGRRNWLSALAISGDTLVVASMNSDSIFLSFDAGATWNARSLELGLGRNLISIRLSQIKNNTLVVCGAFGDTSSTSSPDGPMIFSMPIGTNPTSVVQEEQLQNRYASSLGGFITATPNPTTSAAMVSCLLPQGCTSNIRVTVSSVLGGYQQTAQPVTQVIDDECRVWINTEGLAKGVYVAQLNTIQGQFFTRFVITE